jgi:alkanesulfonate monooxygenase SsuD/methylene tetrahydromethanopterin reductase-like flavin-dependent oxidoreductase (luciferase family)
MKFGVFDHLDHGGIDAAQQYEVRLRLAELYDAAGFHAYHVAEHHGTPLGLAPSPTVFLSAVAQRTRRLRLGPLVLPLPLYHPLRIYEEICMLDQLSGGRLELGVGRGISPYELGFFGMNPDSAQARFRESLELLRSAFGSDTLNFDGEYHSFRDVPLSIRPCQQPHPPLWYGVLKPETAEWSALQGMNIVCGHGPVQEIRAATDRYRATVAAAGVKGAGDPLLGMTRQLVVAPTDAGALAIAKRAFSVFRKSFCYLWHLNDDPLADHLLPEDFEAVQQHGEALCGSPQTVARELERQLRDSGANYLVCRFAFGDLSEQEMLQSVNLFATEVMPGLMHLGDPVQTAA